MSSERRAERGMMSSRKRSHHSATTPTKIVFSGTAGFDSNFMDRDKMSPKKAKLTACSPSKDKAAQ
jgi:hypothetical protein